MTFATLKEIGIACEFVAEQARQYIAHKRFQLSLLPEEALTLDDEDQLRIMQQQISIEHMFSQVCDKQTIIVCDSSPLNSLLYMSNDMRETAITQKLVEKATFGADLIFYAPPVIEGSTVDANRIHDQQQSIKIDESIPKILSEIAPAAWKSIVPLHGDPKARLGQVTSAIMLRRF